MKTVQLAIRNQEFSEALRNLLLRDGTHRVYIVERPDIHLDGVVVVGGDNPENMALLKSDPERFVVVTGSQPSKLSRIWDAGARHVVFEEDSPTTAQLAIIATELRLDGGIGAVRSDNRSHELRVQ